MYNYSKYTSEKTRKKYDVAIIGSGLAGLTAAALLSMAGKKIIILERHYKPGGFTHTFKRGKYEWDVGVHYVGQMNNDASMMKKLFDIVTGHQLEWSDMGTVYDQAIFGSETFDFHKGEEIQKAYLKEKFPNEIEAIDKYFALLKSVGYSSGYFFGERTMPFWLSKTIGYFLRRKQEKYVGRNTYDVLKELTRNEALISLLCARCGNYGLIPQKSSFVMHAAIANHYMGGATYPKGGSFEIFKKISDVITQNEGEIYVKGEVSEIITSGDKVEGLRMEDASLITADYYISNTGLRNTYFQLLKSDDKAQEVRDKLKEIEVSTSHFCVYAGFNKSDEALSFPKNNVWVYKSCHMEDDFAVFRKDPSAEIPLVYISFPSAKDENWHVENKGRSTVQILIPAEYEWLEKWNDSKWMNRPEDYTAFKEGMKERMLEVFFRHFPQAKSSLEIAEISTPLSTQHFANYKKGEIYGLSHSPKRFQQKWIRPYTKYKNLFLAGQDIVTVGVGGALFSGAFAAFGILKWKLLKIIKTNVK